jgi:glycosyltransferase involved in cell wall biosynthesis
MIDAEAVLGRPFDVVHDHCGFTALAMADRLSTPMVHTVHGPFAPELAGFYSAHGNKAEVVAISISQVAHAPLSLRDCRVVPNPIVVADWPLQCEKDDYLLWIGRMTQEKGPQRAIIAAREAGRRLILAGPVQPGQEPFFHEQVEPHVDGDRVRYIGEVGGRRKIDLFARAYALLMPIRWPEPFGMVMIEALACGTPTIAFPEGAATEIVRHGENGFLVHDEHAMAEAVTLVERIDPARARASVAGRYDVSVTADGYEAAYRAAIGVHHHAETAARRFDEGVVRTATRFGAKAPTTGTGADTPAGRLRRGGGGGVTAGSR